MPVCPTFDPALWFLALLLPLAIGCGGGPCVSLSNKICDCETTQTARNTCKQQVKVARDLHATTPEEDQQCALRLDTCTCAAHLLNDLEKCGLAR